MGSIVDVKTDKLILDTIFTNIHFLVAYMDRNFNIIQVNNAYAREWGYPVEYFIGKNHFDLYPNEENERILKEVLEAGRSYHIQEKAFLNPDKQGKTTTSWDWCAYPVKGETGNIEGLLLCLLNKGERKELRTKLQEGERAFNAANERMGKVSPMSRADMEGIRQYVKELERSNKELEDFAYISSHDLQEPLRKIQTFGDRLANKYGDMLGEDGVGYLRGINNSATRMRSLIDSLLAYSRVTTKGKPFDIVPIKEVIDEAVSNLDVYIEETGGSVRVDEISINIRADRTQMIQLFQNLIANGLKFQRKDSTPVVKIYSQIIHSRQRSPNGRTSPPKRSRFFVEDNGIGFDVKYAERIFEPLQRLHSGNEYEGTGIGLAICRKIVDRHGGVIVAESTPDKGSVFSFTVPMDKSDE